jgi:hypothetical protein
MQRVLLYISLVIISLQSISAQTKELFHKNINASLEVKFKPQYPTSSCPNYFIDEIAKAIPKIRMYVKINYQYELETRIVKEGTRYTLSVRVKNITHGGNYKYKDFDFSHLIAPEKIEQTFLIKDLSSNTTNYQKLSIGFRDGDSAQVLIKALKGVISYKVNAKPYSLKLHYTEEQKLKFQEAVSDIDTYYDDAIKLDALKERIEALDFNQADVVALRNVDLKYIEKDLAKIKLQSYMTSLNLESYDPIRLLPKYDSVATMIAARRKIMDEKMGQLDYFYFNQAQIELANKNENEAIEFFEKSIEVNPYFSPSIYQLSLIDYQYKRYEESLIKLQHILNDLKPDLSIKKQSIKLAKMDYDSLMQICNQLNSEERFNQSIGILYKTKAFCDSTKYIECDATIDQYISQAVYGLYASYLSIARASLNKGRLDMCQDYMKMANTFREQNSDKLVGNSSIADRITTDLIAGLIQQSEIENVNGNTSKAMKLLNDAKRLCNQNPNNGCKALINKNEAIVHKQQYEKLIDQSLHFQGPQQAQKRKEYLSLAITYQQLHSDYIPSSLGTDTIIGKVRYMMYQEYIANGINDLKAENYSDAYGEFLAAKKLEDEYVFAKDEKLFEYIQESAKPIILSTLNDGNLKAWGKYYDEAALLLDSAQSESVKWNLNKDPEITTATQKLQNSLKKNVCDQLTKEYNQYIKKANTSLRFDDYYHASQYWNMAIRTASTKPHCKIDYSQAKAQLSKYSFDISYANYMHRADSIQATDPKAAFTVLKLANTLHQENIDKFHSKQVKSLLEIIMDYNNPELNLLGIAYFNEHNKAEESYKLMVLALKSNQEISDELISETAHLLAIHDFDKNQNADTIAEKRFGSAKELQGFKKAYIKASKR